MFQHIFTSLQGYKAKYLKDDITAGIIVAALTIPVAMGYAGVAGLPPIYGLYASMLPVLGYILFASSPQLIFGADAAASAITGSCLAALGVAAGSQDAVSMAALLSLFTGVFLIVFAAFKLGKFSEYISMPVMSGFISGTALSIIIGQVPKIAGIQGSGNDFLGNIAAIAKQAGQIHLLSILLGAVTVLLILRGKKFLPKVPVALVVMVLGTVATAFFRFDTMGVAVVGEIPRGMPPLSLPNLQGIKSISACIGSGFMIAIVVFADSLMSSNSFAQKNNYTIDGNREIFAFGVSNLLSCLSGCSPTSASVSRTAASEQFHGKTQMVSLVAIVIVGIVVTLFSGALYFMPQPILGAIVFAALVGVIDIDVIHNLIKQSRNEAIIWTVSAAGVLVVGTLFGVLIGVILSFIDVIMRIIVPPQAYLGTIENRDGYFDLKNHKRAKAISGVVIYRFSARLFFANVGIFKEGIDKAIEVSHPKKIIVDASGINSIDATAAEELLNLIKSLETQDIKYYFAGQIDSLNKQFEKLGLKTLVQDGHTKKTIQDALNT